MFYTTVPDTPVGTLLIAGDQKGLRYLSFPKQKGQSEAVQPQNGWERNDPFFQDLISQLNAYFVGQLTKFDVRLAPEGTDFQKQVWTALRKVPYGQTASYGDVARAIGRPTASRAVGMANGRNPISIIIPCHRIIGTNGKLVGYGGGLPNKRTLLKLEGVLPVHPAVW